MPWSENSCSGCFRLERSPGGICTHWKAPPCHGAHPVRTSASRFCCGAQSALHYVNDLDTLFRLGDHVRQQIFPFTDRSSLRGHRMRRRDFIVIFGFTAIAQPAIVQAQGPVERPLVAVLMPVSQAAASVWSEGLQRGLRELGYVEGRDVDIVYRYSDGDNARLPALAEDLVRLGPRVFVTSSMLSTFAVKQATETIPIVSATLTDPIGFGLAKATPAQEAK